MTFVHPVAWGLLALLAVPVILYLLPMPRKRIRLPSLLLWGRMLKDRPSTQSWRWLRTLVSLLIEVTILVLLIFAVGKPVFTPAEGQGDRAVLVLDVSASMKAPFEDHTRFDRARDVARSIVEGMASGKEVAVLTAGSSPRIVCGMTDRRGDVLKVLEEVVCTDGGSNLSAALELSLKLAGPDVIGKGTDIYLLSDGRADVSSVKLGGVKLHYYYIGKSVPNVGIVDFKARRAFDFPDEFQAMARIRNASDTQRTVQLTLLVDDNESTTQKLTLAPNASVTQTFSGKVRGQGLLKLKLEPDDAFATDDAAWSLLGSARKPEVLLITGKPDRFMESTLTANFGVTPYLATFEEYMANRPQPDVLIFDGVMPDTLPPGNLLLINPPKGGGLFDVEGDVQSPVVNDWRHDHPILSGLTLKDVYIPFAKKLSTPEWATVLAEASSAKAAPAAAAGSDGTPLLFIGRQGARRVAVLAFDPARSSLRFRVAFPVVIARIFRWFTEEGDISTRSASAGDEVWVQPPDVANVLNVTGPDGTLRAVHSKIKGFAVPATEVGLYRVQSVPTRRDDVHFVANLTDPDESDLSVKSELIFADGTVTGLTVGAAGFGEFWFYAGVGALVLLAVEWYGYHRRFLV